jgi:hypothetical protein
MKLMSLIRKQFGVVDKHAFYEDKTLVEVEWWISSVCRFPDLYWGRLRVFSDGSADAAWDESTTYGFDERAYAETFLAEDEYTRFANLDADDQDYIGVKASDISPPSWNVDGAKFEYLGTYGQAIEHGVGPERRSPNS